MSHLDLNTIVGDKMTPEGVTPITQGAAICASLRENLRQLLAAADPESYAEYRKIKYPAGEGSDTPESRLEATRFIFDRVRDLLLPHYVSTKA